jgi:cytochrome c peroxidase
VLQDGPWTNAPTTFSNLYFQELLNTKWHLRELPNKVVQYNDPNNSLMMLPADIALIEDPEFRKHVERYAKDEQAFFNDFAKVSQSR